jgi:D-alanyl-D-alanine-carboxypeptidase/D-alanyl-D-alanine-endopeptidase
MPLKRTALLLGALLTLIISHPLPAQTAAVPATKPATSPPPPVKLSKETIEQHVKSLVEGEYCPGIVVGVIDSTGSNVYGYGKTNKETGAKPDGDTIFEIGSVSKVFTASCFVMMAQEKKVRLNDAVDSVLGFKIPADVGSKIWFSHLATHTSGLPLHPNNLNSPRPESPYFGYSQRQFQDFLASYVLSRVPGDKYEYSHVGYAVLGQALAKKDAKTFEQMIQDRIATPLGMKDTHVGVPNESAARLAHGYTIDGDKVDLWENPVMEGAMGLSSTANDLLKFAQAHLGIVKTPFEPALHSMQERQMDVDRQNDMGYAWQLGRRLGTLHHTGETGGYHTFLALLPRNKAAVIVLANSAYGAVDLLGANLVRALLGESGAAPLVMKIPRKTDPILLDKYVGDYQAGRQTLHVTREGVNLYIAVESQRKLKLYAESERIFFGKAVDRAIEFGSDPNTGKQMLLFVQPGGPAGLIKVPAQKIE